MKAYYYDNIEGDQRLPHDSGEEVSSETLKKLKVTTTHIPIDRPEAEWQADIDAFAEQHGYKCRDQINVSKAGMGDIYESKIKSFFEEHLHLDDEVRFIVKGSGYFDVREHPTEKWIRVALQPGDMLILPYGIYHRFTLDSNDAIVAIRLFAEEPRWTPYNRDPTLEDNEYRKNYLKEISA